MKIAIPIVLLAAGVAGLLTMAVLYGGIPELQVHQALAGEFPGQRVKFHGVILHIERNVRPLAFSMCDKADPSVIVAVEVDDIRPDLFEEGKDVSVEGVYDPGAKKINADKIYTKCPSKYEASPKGQVDAPAGT